MLINYLLFQLYEGASFPGLNNYLKAKIKSIYKPLFLYITSNLINDNRSTYIKKKYSRETVTLTFIRTCPEMDKKRNQAETSEAN